MTSSIQPTTYLLEVHRLPYLTAIAQSGGGGTVRISGGMDVPFKEGAIIKEGRPRIDVLNYCADYLGCDSLDVDSQGVLVCTPYILPENRPWFGRSTTA